MMSRPFRSISQSNSQKNLDTLISIDQLGDLLQLAWDDGMLSEEVYEAIQLGLLPIQMIEEQTGLKIERSQTEGMLSVRRV